jgi:PAS domain S-box-containing protein
LLVFSAIVDWGSPSFVEELPAGLLSKSVAALILWLPVSYYLTQVAPRLSSFVGGENRPLFDIFLNRPDALRMALDAAEAERLETLSEKKRESVYNEQIVNNIKDALWLADVSQKTVYFVNPAYERLWGRPAADFINDVGMFEASLHPEDRERVVRGYADHSKGDYSIEYRIIRPNGEVRWVHDRVVPIRDEAGVIYRYAGLTTDITELREAEIHRLQLVVEREKVQMLREFVAEVTHDLKTPLSSIHLKLYQASKLEDPVKRAHVLDEVRDQAERMGSMINDLLTLSRLESMSDPSLHRTSLNEIVVNVTQTRVGLASKKDIALTETLVQDVPLILADEDDLGRAIGNLVDNAIHYTPRGGRVELETAKEGRFAVITVRDTGIGIAESDLPNIFKRFFRAENGRAADPGGTGLGLAIVKRVVEAHSGKIDVESQVGSGTTFRVRLPLLTASGD